MKGIADGQYEKCAVAASLAILRGGTDERKSEPTLLNPGGTRTHEANSESTLFNPGGCMKNLLLRPRLQFLLDDNQYEKSAVAA